MEIDDLNERITALEVGEALRLENVPEDQYHASEGYGSSKLKSFMKCPALFKAEMDGLHKTSPAMVIGSAFHCAVLEPDKFHAVYSVAPEINKRTKAGKEEWAELQASGKDFLSPADYQKVIDMRDSCKEKFSRFLSTGSAEVSFWKRHDSGLILKSRIDWQNGDLAIDLKSTADIFGFQRQAVNFGYDIQAVHYLWVSEGIQEMIFLPTSSAEPYLSGQPVMMSFERLLHRESQWNSALYELAESLESGIYRGLPDEPIELDLKPWEVR